MLMRIQELRSHAGLNQTELSAKMGVNQNTISCWENEVALPRTRQLPLLAAVLDCSIDDLFTEDARSDPIIPA